MPLDNQPGLSTKARGRRSASVLPLLAAVASAVALTGAAVYTVDQTACGSPGRYVQHGNQLELIGGCVNRMDLPAVSPSETSNNEGTPSSPLAN